MPCAVKGLQIPRIIFSMASLGWVYLGERKMNAVFKLKIIIIMSGNAERVMSGKAQSKGSWKRCHVNIAMQEFGLILSRS